MRRWRAVDGSLLHIATDGGGAPFEGITGADTRGLLKFAGGYLSALGKGLSNEIGALEVFDDGSGPAVYAGGWTQIIDGMPYKHLLKWDGTSWSGVGDMLDGGLDTFAVFDDGAGPGLYAGGSFTHAGELEVNGIAKWDGVAWTPVGSGVSEPYDGGSARVSRLFVFDDGTGHALYAGGDFTVAGGVRANGIARWNGKQWSALGAGSMEFGVRALISFDDGSGPALYAGGHFLNEEGTATGSVGRWNGTTWIPVGTGAPFSVSAFAVFDDGSGAGPELYAGGLGGSNEALSKLVGSVWHVVGDGADSSISDLVTFDDGTGAALIVLGSFDDVGGLPIAGLARWDGTTWSDMGPPFLSPGGTQLRTSEALVFNDGGVKSLLVCGRFRASPVGDSFLAKWRGCVPACLGDLVSTSTFATVPDGVIDSADLAYLLNEWGANPGSAADFVTSATFQPPPDGTVDGADLAVLLGAWGECE